LLVLILRSAYAEEIPQTRTGVRASRRMRTAAPSCFETHRGALGLWKYLRSRAAAMLLSMRASTNPRLYGMTVASVSLFPACYLQGTLQLQRVWRFSALRASKCRRGCRPGAGARS